jgi:hypothetical protein
MRLNKTCILRIQLRPQIRVSYQCLLCDLIWSRYAGRSSVLAGARTANDSTNIITISKCIGNPLDDKNPESFTTPISAGSMVKAKRSA